MTADLLSTLLWVPFGIVALITGLIYGVSGYKKGLWRALGGLGAVVLSIVASVWLARWIAGLAAPELAAVLPLEFILPEAYSNPLTVAAIQMLLPAVICVVLSMVLFGLLMLVFTPIISKIVGVLLGKGLIRCNILLKWLGFAVGAVSALAFTLCWLCPLYGSLGAAAPVATLLVETVQMEDPLQQEQARLYVDSINGHILVQLSAAEPVKSVYTELSRVTIGDETASLTEMTDTVETLLPFFQGTDSIPDPTDPNVSQDTDSGLESLLPQQVWEQFEDLDLQQVVEQFGGEKQDEIMQALDQLGADTLEEAKKLVENMNTDEIMDLIDKLDLDWIKEAMTGSAAE